MQIFKKKIPLLSMLPKEIYSNLDFSEFQLPNDFVNRLREELERELGAFVMTYKYDPFKKFKFSDNQLCSIIACAKLSEKQIDILNSKEKLAKNCGISFAVYEKPLRFLSRGKL